MFNFKELSLKGLYEITPFVACDERGSFIKDYSLDIFAKNGIEYHLKEVFYTISVKGVLRGMHFQNVRGQAKLVRVIKGKVFDVCVDLRKESPTYKKWIGVELSESNNKELLIPHGFAHGYYVLEDSIVSYKCDEKFYSEYDDGILWNDPLVNIEWPAESNQVLILSEKDKNLQSLAEFEKKKF